jgi:Peptidase family M28
VRAVEVRNVVSGPHLSRVALNSEQQASAGRLGRDVGVLAGDIGERNVWKYDMLMAAERYVRGELEKTGRAVSEQAYGCRRGMVRNLVLEMPGEGRGSGVVVVGAHYDTVDGTPGADDNASAVAGLLEVARQLAARRFRRTIRFVAFVNEEPPFYKGPEMGSLVYARMCRARGDRIIGMINLEMIGCYSDARRSQPYPPLFGLQRVLPDRGNFVVIGSNVGSAGFLTRVCWGFRRSVRFPMLPMVTPRGMLGLSMSDNWSFWQCGYPAVMVTDTAFLRNRHYHRPTDTPERLNIPAMTRVVEGVSGAVARLAGEMG